MSSEAYLLNRKTRAVRELVYVIEQLIERLCRKEGRNRCTPFNPLRTPPPLTDNPRSVRMDSVVVVIASDVDLISYLIQI